jgi:hypothetical protein
MLRSSRKTAKKGALAADPDTIRDAIKAVGGDTQVTGE